MHILLCLLYSIALYILLLHCTIYALATLYVSTSDPPGCAQRVHAQLRRLMGMFMCMVCFVSFKSASGLGRHEQATEHQRTLPKLSTKQTKGRKRYTFRAKRDHLLSVRTVSEGCGGDMFHARKIVSLRTGVSVDCLRDWENKSETILRYARTRRLGGSKAIGYPTPHWPEAEFELYMAFIYRRRYQALRVTRSWLKRTFKHIRHTQGHNVDGWFPSEGWCCRFCKRWEITSQSRTNKKKFSIEERLSSIQQFHTYWLRSVQRRQPSRCDTYGYYPATHIYAMDQVPMPFSSPAKKTMNEKGAPRGCRFTAASEDDKRFCTINVTICANATTQDVDIELIFDSDTGGEKISDEEKAAMALYPNVIVRWQPKAWADESIMLDYIRDFRLQTIAKGNVALFLDNHGSQQTTRMRNMMKMLDIEYIFTPANCTDCVSPVDRNVGVWLKNRVYRFQDEEMDLYENRNWSLAAGKGGLTKSEKRMHIVRWMSKAWKDFQTTEQHNCKASFVDTGILIAQDGSEDHLIRLWPKAKNGEYVF
jgi:hypothetical protein